MTWANYATSSQMATIANRNFLVVSALSAGIRLASCEQTLISAISTRAPNALAQDGPSATTAKWTGTISRGLKPLTRKTTILCCIIRLSTICSFSATSKSLLWVGFHPETQSRSPWASEPPSTQLVRSRCTPEAKIVRQQHHESLPIIEIRCRDDDGDKQAKRIDQHVAVAPLYFL